MNKLTPAQEKRFEKWLYDNPKGNPLFYALKDNGITFRSAEHLNTIVCKLEEEVKQHLASELARQRRELLERI